MAMKTDHVPVKIDSIPKSHRFKNFHFSSMLTSVPLFCLYFILKLHVNFCMLVTYGIISYIKCYSIMFRIVWYNSYYSLGDLRFYYLIFRQINHWNKHKCNSLCVMMMHHKIFFVEPKYVMTIYEHKTLCLAIAT